MSLIILFSKFIVKPSTVEEDEEEELRKLQAEMAV